MDQGPLLARLRRLPGVAELPEAAGFDHHDDLALDRLARALLERFREESDGEAFTLLFELTHPRLLRIATQLARRLLPSADPDDMVAALMARLFADVRSPTRTPVRRFLALAYTSMRNDLLDQLRHRRRAQDGGRLYHDALPAPADPADVAQAQEEERLLQRYGASLADLTDECFHQLETRDKRALVARELLGLTYERVAGLLGLDVGQVGMVIRRARQHLADRLVQRLTDQGHRLRFADGEEPGGDPLDAAQAEVLAGLVSRERVKNVRSLVQHMLGRAADAGRRRLADLVYELAKACLLSAPDFSERMLVRTAPRRREVVANDLRHMAARLQGVDGPVDLAGIDTAAGSALDDAERCLQVLARIEGPSGRQQVALALVEVQRGQPGRAEALLRPLLEAELPAVTRQNVHRNLVLALLRQERHAEARELAEAGADEWPDDPARVMNLCFCTARLGDAPAFREHVRHLLAIEDATPSERVAHWIENVLPGLVDHLGLSSAALLGDRSHAGSPDREEGTTS